MKKKDLGAVSRPDGISEVEASPGCTDQPVEKRSFGHVLLETKIGDCLAKPKFLKSHIHAQLLGGGILWGWGGIMTASSWTEYLQELAFY